MNTERYKLIGQPNANHTAYVQAVLVYNKAKATYQSTYTAVHNRNWTSVWNDAYNNTYSNYSGSIDAAKNAYNQAVSALNASLRSNDLAIQERKNAVTNLKLNDPTVSLQSQLKTAQMNLADATITAPVAGTITDVNIQVGARPAGALFTIQDTQTMEVSTNIAEYDIASLKDGQAVRITTDATGDEILDGTIKRLAPTAMNAAGDFEVISGFDKIDDRLRIGMNAKLTLVVDSRPQVFAVPYDAIVKNAAGATTVVALRDDGITRYEVPVTVGLETDYFVEIESSELKAGLKILNDPSGNNVATTTTFGGPFG
jgi:HlyD family secretion protein